MTSRFDPRAIEATLQLLSAKWPRCFFVFEQRRRPLALRIDQQIAAALGDIITSDDLNAALRFYTGNLCYLHACREGTARIGLDGEPAGIVTAAEAAYAVRLIAQRQLKAKSAAKANKLTTAQATKLAPRPVPKRASLADLREAARQRRMVTAS